MIKVRPWAKHWVLQFAGWAGVVCCVGIGLWNPTDVAFTAGHKKHSKIHLNGKLVTVYWPDGDTFRLVLPNRRGPSARLMGYNTLENYGPVHKWGGWTAQALFHVGNQASKVARSQAWKCFTKPGSGGYGRILADCPKLAQTLISKGLAHVFSVSEAGDPKLLKLQKEAMKKKVGIWAKGTPEFIVTSVHSASMFRRRAYNRLIRTSTGGSVMYRHGDQYNTCGWVCLRGSCMLYVPYKRRFGELKASCLATQPPRTRPASQPASQPKKR